MIDRLRVLSSRIRGFFTGRRLDQDFEHELDSHFAMLTEENIRRGMSPDEARRAARLRLGNSAQLRESHHDLRTFPFLESVIADIRFALRMLRKNPGFTAVAVLTLAIGMGGTTSVFSVVDRILFRSLPYPHPEQLVSVGTVVPIVDKNEFMFGGVYLQLRDHPGPFMSVTSFSPGSAGCDLATQIPMRLNCERVASTFLPTFGIEPLLGRNFAREEDLPNAPRVAVISYGLWKSQFGSEPNVIGRVISLDGQPTTVTGVLPPDFEFPTLAQVDVLIPQALDEASQRGSPFLGSVLRVFGRLKPGITPPQAAAALQPLFQIALQETPPEFRKEMRSTVRSLRDRQVGDVRLASSVLLGAVCAVLLIACTNIANLLLARATARRREIAVRVALGAGRGRLLRQALTESVLLGALGGAMGLVFAWLLLHLFIAIAPEGIPRLADAGLNVRVLVFAFAVSIGSGILFGFASVPPPIPPAETLRGQESGRLPRNFLRSFLAAAQIAASLVLLSAAGLLLRSLWNMERVPLGMDTEHVVTANIVLGKYRYATSVQQHRFFEDLEQRIQQFPGISAFAISDTVPPSGGMRATRFSSIALDGHAIDLTRTGATAGWRSVTPGYFSVLGVPILRGRAFTEQDREPGQDSVVVSSSMAQLLFPGQDPLDRKLRFGQTGPWSTVIGVAGNVRNAGIAENAGPEYYVVRKHAPEDGLNHSTVMVRSTLNPKPVADWIRQEIAALDPTLPVTIVTMNDRVGQLEQRPRFSAVLLGFFAGMGVSLAAIGIYGVIVFLVAQRAHEIGVRMALGAQRADILILVMEEGLKLVVVGSAIGLFATVFATRLLSSLLFGVTPEDPITLSVVTALLVLVALAACWIPARRATRVDPMVALRHE
jgi:putative ABC transport system permease protein